MREPRTGGLHLPKDVGVAESVAQTIETRWNTIGAVDAHLQQHGIHANPLPDIVCPVVTTEALITTNITEFTTIFSAQLRWYNYVTRLLADVRAVLLQVENEMDDIAAAKRTFFRQLGEGKKKTERMSAAEMQDSILQDPHFRDLKLQQQQLEQQKLKLDAWGESLDRNLKTVSRQIENRRAEGIGGQREGNMSGDANGTWRNNPGIRGPGGR